MLRMFAALGVCRFQAQGFPLVTVLSFKMSCRVIQSVFLTTIAIFEDNSEFVLDLFAYVKRFVESKRLRHKRS